MVFSSSNTPTEGVCTVTSALLRNVQFSTVGIFVLLIPVLRQLGPGNEFYYALHEHDELQPRVMLQTHVHLLRFWLCITNDSSLFRTGP